ncbi:unnamed protein product [Sympodiomycopsis kandeliae]
MSGPQSGFASGSGPIAGPFKPLALRPSTPPPNSLTSSSASIPWPTKHKRSFMTDCSDVMSAKDFALSVGSQLHKAGRKAQKGSELLKSVGLALPDLPDVQQLCADWKGLASAPLKGSEAAQEKLHCQRFTHFAALLGRYLPGIGSKKVFNSCGNFVLGGGRNVKGSVKPDIVVTRGTVTEAELQKPGVFTKVHVLAECKTASGAAFHGQCAKYVERFGRPGATYDFVLGVKGYKVTVMLFTAKAWSELVKFDYRDATEEVLKWLYLVLRDDKVDNKVPLAFRDGLKLLDSGVVASMYHGGLDKALLVDGEETLQLSPIELGKTVFRSPGLFGSKTRVWAVRGSLKSAATGRGAEVAEALIVKHSFARPGRVPNGHFFMEEVRRLAEQRSKAGRWMAESVGIWVDDRFLSPMAEMKARIGVVHVMRPGRGATWQDAFATASVADILRAARDVVRIIAAMRPFHHRDISMNNLMMDPGAVEDGFEELRMEAWLSWQQGGPAPPLTAQVIDFERGRWGVDPSDLGQRKAMQNDDARDPDESIDDAHTGTLPFLARAQGTVRRLMQEGEEERFSEMFEWVRQHGHHQHWHDLESLLLCVLIAVFSKWRREIRGIREVLEQWYSSGSVSAGRGQWLDGQAKQLVDCVWKSPDIGSSEKEVAELLLTAFEKMKPTFEDSVGSRSDSYFDAIKKSFNTLDKKKPFRSVLEVIIDTIPLVEAAEQKVSSPSLRPVADGKRKAEEDSDDAISKKVKSS